MRERGVAWVIPLLADPPPQKVVGRCAQLGITQTTHARHPSIEKGEGKR
jgi:hypothetical protein